MAINLTLERKTWPRVRVLGAPTFNSRYVPLPMWRVGMRGFGIEVLRWNRCALPSVGEAMLQFRYGMINGYLVGAQPESQNNQPWDPSSFSISAPDLRGWEIRIEVAEMSASEPEWSTAWWGQVEDQRDVDWPGADYPAGVRSYYCVDGFYRAKRWMLDCHTAVEDDQYFIQVDGHPGYNVGCDGRVIGNRSPVDFADIPDEQLANAPALLQLAQLADTAYCLHTHQGKAGARAFTVKTAIESALRERRPFGQPVFSFNGTDALLDDEIAMPVHEGESAWDLTARHCRRERGRGGVWVSWNADDADPMAPLEVFLDVQPQTYADITYVDPSTGDTETIPGAANTDLGRLSTAIAVDLQGDHRLVAEDFQISQPNIHRADAVETLSEKIQVLATLSYFDTVEDLSISLAERWTSTRADDFAALDPAERISDGWTPMWCLHGLPLGWQGKSGDGNGGGFFGCDARCDDDGYFTTSASVSLDAGATVNITSPLLIRILPDLPIYEGYDYAGAAEAHGAFTPKRIIGSQSELDETSMPARRAPFAFIRTEDDTYVFAHELADGYGMTLQVRGRDLLNYSPKDQSEGTRQVSDTSADNLAAAYDLEALGFTVGLEMPHRVRRRTVRQVAGVDVTVLRTVRVRVPDLHLWLATSGAIWDIDAEAEGAAKRNAAGGINATMGILRDDRPALSRIHAMACAWYLNDRRTATWSLRCCGFLLDFENSTTDAADNPTTERIEYPNVGQVVHGMYAGGQVRTLDTPITNKAYDHTTGITTWQTDWPELDTSR